MQRYFTVFRNQASLLASKSRLHPNRSIASVSQRLNSTRAAKHKYQPSPLFSLTNKTQLQKPNNYHVLFATQSANLHYFQFNSSLNNRMSQSNTKNSNNTKTTSTTTSTSKTSKRKIRIYTKTGDKGESSLFTSERRSKDDPIFEALGNTDELSAAIGIAREYCIKVNNGLDSNLEEIQSRLIDIGAAIATPDSSNNSNKKVSESKKQRVYFADSNVETLEVWIDKLDENLPALKNFILPSGGLASSHLHLARAICRRCERSLIKLKNRNDLLQTSVNVYINRLSDYLFMAARYAAQFENKPEIIYKKAQNTESKEDK